MTMNNTIFLAATLILSLASSAALRGDIRIDWYTIDGGGEMFSTGGSFELGGTIGQPDAGPGSAGMTGGSFSLIGGFWPVAHAALPGDCDGDDDVDITDFVYVADCLSGPAVWPGDDCACADIDDDGDADLADFAQFQRAFTGP